MKQIYNKKSTNNLIFATKELINYYYRLFLNQDIRPIKPGQIEKKKTYFIYKFKNILKNNPNPNIKYSKNHISPFIVTTSILQDDSIVKMFINLGVNINTQNKNKQTVIMEAVRVKNPVIINLLLNNGANTDLKNIDEKTVYEIRTSIEIKLILNNLLQKEITNIEKNIEELNYAAEAKKVQEELKKLKEKESIQKNFQEEILLYLKSKTTEYK